MSRQFYSWLCFSFKSMRKPRSRTSSWSLRTFWWGLGRGRVSESTKRRFPRSLISGAEKLYNKTHKTTFWQINSLLLVFSLKLISQMKMRRKETRKSRESIKIPHSFNQHKPKIRSKWTKTSKKSVKWIGHRKLINWVIIIQFKLSPQPRFLQKIL